MSGRINDIAMISRLAKSILKLPIQLYRLTIKPLVGWRCRHLPTCSDYALDAIELNGAWRGLWLTVSRLWRCQPWGTHGYDPVPDITRDRNTLAPWRYGRWRQCYNDPTEADDTATRTG